MQGATNCGIREEQEAQLYIYASPVQLIPSTVPHNFTPIEQIEHVQQSCTVLKKIAAPKLRLTNQFTIVIIRFKSKSNNHTVSVDPEKQNKNSLA